VVGQGSCKLLKLTSSGYKGLAGADLDSERKRLTGATTAGPVASTSSAAAAPRAAVPSVPATQAARGPYAGYTSYTQHVRKQQPPSYPSYETSTTNNPYAPTQQSHMQQPAYRQPQQSYGALYAASGSLTQSPHLCQQQAPAPVPAMPPPPPRAATGTPSNAGLPPPPKRDNAGWNNAPPVAPPPHAPSHLNLNKPTATRAPFPNGAFTCVFSSRIALRQSRNWEQDTYCRV